MLDTCCGAEERTNARRTVCWPLYPGSGSAARPADGAGSELDVRLNSLR